MPDFGVPESRSEAILQNILGANNTLQPPQSRIEALLQEMLESGSLPAVTTDDIGASLSVAQKTVPGDAIIPEQAITLQAESWTDVSLNGTIYSEVGERLVMVVFDGVTYETRFLKDDDYVYVAEIYDQVTGLEAFITVNTLDHTAMATVWTVAGGAHTISVFGVGAVAEWSVDPYPGYDVVVGADSHINDISHYTFVKHNWETIKRKVLAGEPVTGFIYTRWNYDDAVQGDTNGDIIPLDSIDVMSSSASMKFGSVKVIGKYGTSGVQLFIDYVTINLDVVTGNPLSIPVFIHTSKTLA